MAIARQSEQGMQTPGAIGHVEQRVYTSLASAVPMRDSEQELCRKLASLAQILYEQRDLSDEDLDDILDGIRTLS